MNKFSRILRVLLHPRELRMALSGLSVRLAGDEALGGLTDEETDALVRWAEGVRRFVEIGTLFGFTARAVAQRAQVEVTAVDDFSWNPFGLTPIQHENFARKVLRDSGVKLVKAEAVDFLAGMDGESTMVFLDGDHSYEGVKAELELLKGTRVAIVAGHDYGNPNFGVTRAVREVFGTPDEVVGMCWLKNCPFNDC